MKSAFKFALSGIVVIAAGIPVASFGQTGDTRGNTYRPVETTGSRDAYPEYSRSWLPGTRAGYIGINLGTPEYDNTCAGGFRCSDPDLGGKIYTGGQFNKWLGLEFGYAHFGTQERNGGDTRAQGLNLSLVGTVPFNNIFSVFGKVGGTYGWTKTSGSVGATGNENGLGLSYGAGLGFNLSRSTQLVLEYDKHRFDFSSGKNDVELYSVGVKFRF